jgi:hypothetical protein
MSDDELEPKPPEAMKVARRAVVLSVITCRGFSEGFADKEEGADLVRRSIAWLDSLAIDQELCAWERSILSTPFGHLSEKDIIKASWLCEGLIVLAWALNRVDILSYDIQCDPPEVANSLGYLQPCFAGIRSGKLVSCEQDLVWHRPSWDQLLRYVVHDRLPPLLHCRDTWVEPNSPYEFFPWGHFILLPLLWKSHVRVQPLRLSYLRPLGRDRPNLLRNRPCPTMMKSY